MFLAGADGTTPELRAPSIKGALRFWWRAMNGHLPLDDLRKNGQLVQKGLRSIEGEIFGNTEQRASFIIRVLMSESTPFQIGQEKPVPHKNYPKSAILIKQSFKIHLALIKDNLFKINQLENLFVLTCLLGGIGGRMRRGFGSVTIVKKNDKPFQELPTDIGMILNYLNSIAPYFVQGLDQSGQKCIFSRFPRMEAYPFIKQIQLGRKQSDLTRKIADTTHQLHQTAFRDYEYTMGGIRNGRWASPIYVSALRNKDGYICPIITTLQSVPKNNLNKINLTLQETFKNQIL
ncbi:MAG: type module protein Cmr1 [Bacteroidota bacterium]|jgi:CRISPR-associated protein Cmr1